jgi:hypothetical protein
MTEIAVKFEEDHNPDNPTVLGVLLLSVYSQNCWIVHSVLVPLIHDGMFPMTITHDV